MTTKATSSKKTTKTSGKGALAVDPKAPIADQLAALDKKIKAGTATTAEHHQRNSLYNQVQTQKANGGAAPVAPTPQQVQTDQYNDTMVKAGGAQNNQLDQINKQGNFDPQTMGIQKFDYQGPQVQQFQPGDFQQQFQGAYDHALDQFNRSSQPAFDRQNQDFQQMAAERGWDPSSKVYQDSLKQIQDSQNSARLNAQDTAYQTGLGAQNQAYTQQSNTYGQNLGAQGQQFGQYGTGYSQNLGAQGQQFGQASSTYQMPFQSLSALSPYLQAQYGSQQAQQQQGYTQQNAAQGQDYAKELAALQQRYQMQNQQFAVDHRMGGGGGGGGGGHGSGALTLQDQMALQNNAFYNQMVLNGTAAPQSNVPSTGNSAIQGVANGIGLGVTAGLTR